MRWKSSSGVVADADHAGGRVLRDGLGDHPRGIGEVDQPRIRTPLLDNTRIRQRDRNGAQGHGNSPRPGSFLPWVSVGHCGLLVERTGGDASNPNTVQDKGGAVNRVLSGGSDTDAQAPSFNAPPGCGPIRP